MTPIKLTDARNTPDASRDGKVNLTAITPRYSSIFGFNLDSSLMLLEHSGYYAVYTGDGKYLRDLPFAIAGSNANPVWSRSDKELVYFIVGSSVKSCNVTTRAIELVMHFSGYSALTTFGESDIADDGNYLVLAGDGKHVFTLDLDYKTKGLPVDLPNIESIHLTPQNNVLVKYHTNGTGRYQGCELFGENMNFMRQVLPYNAHADMMLNGNGDEILIHGDGAANIVATNLTYKLEPQITIFKSVYALAQHISCPTGKDFFFVDRYDPTNAIAGDILKVWLDGKSEVLCLHGSKRTPPDTYTYQPKVSCNRDGTKIVWASNMGTATPDTFMLTMAASQPVPQPVPPVLTFDLSRYDCEIKRGILTVRAA